MSYYNHRRFRPNYPQKVFVNPDNFKKRLETLQKVADLSDWEKNFLQSISEFYGKRSEVSEKQSATFEKLEKKFSVENVKARDNWEASFTDAMRKDFHVCCEYYSSTAYYGNILNWWKDKLEKGVKDYVPTQVSYEKLVSNPYAQRVLTAKHATPKYVKGSMVLFRANAKEWIIGTTPGIKHDYLNDVYPRHSSKNPKDNPQIVLSSNGAPRSAAVGSKLYIVYSVKEGIKRITEERFIKKFKKLSE